MASKLTNLLELMSPVVKTVTKTTWGLTMLNEGLEVVIQNLIDKLLKRIPGFSGSIGKIDVHPLSGRIEILQFRLKKKVTRERAEPFIFIPKITFTLRWKELVHKHVVGHIVMEGPVLVLDVQRWKPQSPPRPNPERRHDSASTWQGQVKRILPFHIENLVIKNGAVKLSNVVSQTEEDVHFHAIHMRLRDVSNSPQLSSRRWTTAEATYRLGSSGEGEWQAQGILLDPTPLFKSQIKLRGFELSSVQNIIRHYFNVELTQGTFEIFADAEAQEGKFKGYAEPVFHHLHLRPMWPSGLWRKLKTLLIQGLVQLLRNKTTDRIATRIYFDGSFENPRVEWIAAIGNFLKNAFGRAFKSRLEPRVFDYLRRRPPAAENAYRYEGPRSPGIPTLLKESFSRWKAHEVPRMSAALSYYTCFSLAPLLLLLIAVVGLVFGRDAAQGQILNQLSGLVGKQSAETIQTMIAAAWQPTKGILASVISVGTLLAGALGVLSELKTGLNRVMKTTEPGGLGEIVKERAKYLGFILGIGFLLLVSLAVSAAAAALGHFLAQTLPFPKLLLQAIDIGLSLGIITILFAMIFRFLPNFRLPWRSVWSGSFFTAILFTLGKFGLGLYLGRSSVASSYGAAGSILIVLLWVYYSALILYYGAEFTKAHSETRGTPSHG